MSVFEELAIYFWVAIAMVFALRITLVFWPTLNIWVHILDVVLCLSLVVSAANYQVAADQMFNKWIIVILFCAITVGAVIPPYRGMKRMTKEDYA